MSEKEEFKCHNCSSSLDYLLISNTSSLIISRSESCNSCMADVKCCKNCVFYDEASHNSCKESQAEKVLDKEKANFCDLFKPSLGKKNCGDTKKDDVLSDLDDLFK